MNFEASFTARAGMNAEPISTESYHSRTHFELERSNVFGRAWLAIARVEELPAPKDYIVRDVEILKAQLVVARGLDGTISCFHNVCSHRTNQVVLDRQGSTSAFMCQYHKWTYSLDGSLRGVPDEAAFFGLDKKACGLRSVAFDIWNGFIFVNFEETPSTSLQEFLGEIGEELKDLHLPFANNPVIFEAMLDCNWKAIFDAFAETYHTSGIHSNTFADTFISRSNPFGRANDMRFMTPHSQANFAGNPDYTPPLNQKIARLATAYMTSVTLAPIGNVFGEGTDEIARMERHPMVNKAAAAPWIGDVNVIFPNLHLDISPGGFWTHQFWPLSPGRTRWESRWYIAAPRTIAERFHQEHYVAKLADIILEDIGTTERVQAGVESGAKPIMYLNDTEAQIRFNQLQLDKWIRAGSAAEALAR